MINKVKDYADDAVYFAVPYVQAAGENASKAAKYAKKYLFKNARKKVKAAKRYRFILKLKKVLEFATTATLLVASVLALASMLKMKFENKNIND